MRVKQGKSGSMDMSYKGSMPNTSGKLSTNTAPNPNNSGASTGVRKASGQGQGTTGPISNKNPFPKGLA